jgi:hypothetical protein
VKYRYIPLMSIMILLASCNGEDGGSTASDTQVDYGPEHLDLAIADTIGVELGRPEYVFGQIVEAVRTPEGSVLVLDSSTMSVRQFDGTGEFLASVGRQGTGPGEFQMPRGMTVLENGSVIVSDMGGGALSVFDDSLRWVENITGFFPRPPYSVTPAGDSSFVGMMPAFDREQGLTGYTIARLEDSSEPSVVYSSEMRPFDPSRFGPLAEEEQPVFTSDLAGRVFIAQPGSDRIQVTGYMPDGTEFLHIEERVERVEKTQAELDAEEEEFQEISSRMGRRFRGADPTFDPIPFRRAVSELGIDRDNRLWVRLGTLRYPFWNVYDMNGQLLFTASISPDDPDADGMTVRVTENGIIAWVPDPTTWPRVYLVEEPEAP